MIDRLRYKALGYLLSGAAALLGSGTIFYHWVERLRWLDALYLSFTTLTTVGYGDVYPKTDAGKIFTMLYMALGVVLLFGFIGYVSNAAHSKDSVKDLLFHPEESSAAEPESKSPEP